MLADTRVRLTDVKAFNTLHYTMSGQTPDHISLYLYVILSSYSGSKVSMSEEHCPVDCRSTSTPLEVLDGKSFGCA